MTEMHNVLEDLRAGKPLDDNGPGALEQRSIAVLKQIHDDLDRAVADAYGWPITLSEEEIIFRLVELNATRAAEERSGDIRWLRPEYQNKSANQVTIDVGSEDEDSSFQTTTGARQPWPATLPDRVRLVRDFILQSSSPVEPGAVARNFIRARAPKSTAILDTRSPSARPQKTARCTRVDGSPSANGQSLCHLKTHSGESARADEFFHRVAARFLRTRGRKRIQTGGCKRPLCRERAIAAVHTR
jgi:hypothetical protein